MIEPRFQHSIESVCVWWSLFSFLPSPHPPLHIFISSFFLFSKKRKRLRAQSGHSLNLVLSKCPPFNLHSLCLCYYLHPFFVCVLYFLLANCPFSFCLSLQMLTHPFSILLVLSYSLQSTRSQTLPWDWPTGLVVRAPSQPSCLGSSV